MNHHSRDNIDPHANKRVFTNGHRKPHNPSLNRSGYLFGDSKAELLERFSVILGGVAPVFALLATPFPFTTVLLNTHQNEKMRPVLIPKRG